MPVAKVTWFYELTGQGWSFSLFHNYAAQLSELVTPAQTVAKAIALGTTTSNILRYVRFSDDAIRGDSFIADLTSAGASSAGWPTNGILAPPTAEPNACVECRMESGTLFRKSFFFSGILLGDVDAGVPYTPSPQLLASIIGLRLAVNNLWSFKSRDATTGVIAFTGAVAQNPLTPGQWVLSFPAPPGLAVGDRVVVTGVNPRGFGLTGGYFVAAVTAGPPTWTVTIQGGSPNIKSGFLYNGGGKVQKLLSTYRTITQIFIRRPASRKRGRFFGQRAGRIRNRATTR